jgi:hypothetical protein
MAPSGADLLAGIPPEHLAGLAGGVAAPALGRLLRRRLDALDLLLLATAGVHLGLAPSHIGDSPGLALLFLANGIAYGALVIMPRRRWWRPAVAGLLLATILAYLIYTGSQHETPEPIGLADKLIELVALGLVLAPRRATAPRWLGASAASLAAVFLTGLGLWAEDLAGAGHEHGATAVACTVSQHRPGPGTVLRPVACTVSPAQQAAANQLVSETRSGIARYQDVRVAMAAGYHPANPDLDGTAHYSAPFGTGGGLDPRHPAALVYAHTRHGAVLLGAMYQMPRPGEPGPDVGGALTPWHYHTNICLSLPGLLLSGLSTPWGQCPPGSVRVGSADQLHVWTAANPNGPFGDLDQAWLRRLVAS